MKYALSRVLEKKRRLDEIEADDRPSFRDLGRSSGDPCLGWFIAKLVAHVYTVQLSKDLANPDIKEFLNQDA